MKLQSASVKEISRIAVGVAACDCIMIAGLFLLSQFGIGTFSYRIFVGALGGSIVAIANFAALCLTVQNAVNIDSMNGSSRSVGKQVHTCYLVTVGVALLASHNVCSEGIGTSGKT